MSDKRQNIIPASDSPAPPANINYQTGTPFQTGKERTRDGSQAGQYQAQATSQQLTEKDLKGAGRKSKFPKLLLLFVPLILIFAFFLLAALVKRPTTTKYFGKQNQIVWWGTEYDGSVYADVIAKYQNENPNIRISYQQQSLTDYRERLASAFSKGNGPDIFEIHNSWPIMFRSEMFPVPQNILSTNDYTQTYYPVIVNDMKQGSSFIGIPLEYDAITLFVNQDIFAAATKEPPTSWNEFSDLSSSLSQSVNGQLLQSGAALGLTSNVDYWPEILGLMLYQNNVNPTKPKGKMAGDVFAFYNLFNAKGVWSDKFPGSTSYFAKGKVAMLFAPVRSVSEIQNANPTFRYRTVNLPQLPRNKPTDPVYAYATYWSQSVWNKSVNSNEAWKFLKFISSDVNLQEINRRRKEKYATEMPYPKPGMNLVYREDSIIGSVVALAPYAKSYYLADKTKDGQNGVNTQMNKIFSEILLKGFNEVQANTDITTLLAKYSSVK